MRLLHIRSGFLIWRLVACAGVVAGVFLCPCEAWAWGPDAHRKIGKLALDALPPDYRTSIAPYRSSLLRGFTLEHQEGSGRADNLSSGLSIVSDIQLLMLIPHDETGLSHYFAYRIGMVGSSVADRTLPLLCVSASDRSIQETFESDIDIDVASFQAHNISPVCLTYPDSYLERVSDGARLSVNRVRTAYLAGGGYAACKKDVALPAFERAVEAVASIWMTILSNEPMPSAIPGSRRVNYYIDQIRYSSTNGYLDDVFSALEALNRESRRVPLSPTFVGEDFFSLSCSSQTERIYELAELVDPQSAAISERKRTCRKYIAEHPEKEEDPFPKRRIPRHLHGRNGKQPDIYVYQHKSGLLLLTSKVKEVGSDYVLLNLEPIKKIVKRKVVKKVLGQPQTEEFNLEEIIRFYANDYGVSPALVKAIIKVESDFNPYVVSSAGARGLMQLMPSTALEMQVGDIFDPSDNIGGGVQYISRMLELFNNDVRLALAAYNAGPGNVLHYGGIPPFKETKAYVPRVLDYYERYRKDPSPVRLKVALNKKPAPDYLPEVEVIEEVVEEVTVSYPLPPKPKVTGDHVIVYLKNGNTMRGKAYTKTPKGIRLELENGSILIREDLISKIT